MQNKKEVEKIIERFNKLIKIFPEKIQKLLWLISDENKFLAQEIRIGNKLRIIYGLKTEFLDVRITQTEIKEIFNHICKYSVYSFEHQLKNGFITFEGGHRIGVGASAVIKNGEIVSVKDITSLNIRIAKEIRGCSNEILENIIKSKFGALIVGVPSSGKTTILRDLAKNISEGKKVTIIDERFEIASCFNGKIQMDIGNSDVLSGFPKASGILRAVRSLSPDYIICDEIGNFKEVLAVKQVLNSGVKMICSIHAKDENELLKKPQAVLLLKSGAFEKVIFLDDKKTGKILKIVKAGEIFERQNNRITSHNIFRRTCGKKFFKQICR